MQSVDDTDFYTYTCIYILIAYSLTFFFAFSNYSEGDKTTSHVQIKRRKISFEQLQKMQYEVK